MKKLTSLLLLLLVLSASLFSCNPNGNESNTSSASTSENSKDLYKDANGKYSSKLEVKNWEGRTFTILVRGEAAGTYQSEEFTTESTLYGDTLNNAVQQRNDKVEETYNVKIVPIRSDKIDEDIRNEAIASTGAYDAIMPTLPGCAKYAQDGFLYDLTTLENLDLNAPWFDANATEAFSISNKVFFTTGDITILNKVCTPSVLFNKAMISQYGLENPYELVNNHQWTFDKLVEMAKKVTSIKTSDGSISKDNIYGMLSAYGDAINFYGGAGQTLCSKDSEDMPYLTVNSEESITVAQKILTTLQNADWLVFAEKFEAPIWVTSFATFLEGRALFRPSGFSATTKARQQSEIEFGILPTPLWNTDQDDYVSYCGTGEVAGIAIPLSCSDPEYSAYMVEVCSVEAKNFITPAYYEVNLKGKDVRDDESEQMLDIIFGNIVYDVGEVYDFGGVKSMFGTLMSTGSPEIVSHLESIKSTIDADIQKTIANYENP